MAKKNIFNVKTESPDDYILSGKKKIYYDNASLQDMYLEDTEQEELYDYDDYKDWVNDYSDEDWIKDFAE